MSRISIALLAVAGFAGTAGAQPGNLPLSPGIRPDSTFGPGMPYVAPRYGQPGGGYPVVGLWAGGYTSYGGFGGYGSTFGGYSFSSYPYYGYPTYGYPTYGTLFVQPQQAVELPRRAEPFVALANEFPATLSLQFPAAAEVWLNGEAVKGAAAETRVLNSPVLKPGATFTFEVKARWAAGGKTYESTRAVTLGPGDRSRLFVVSGTEVK